MFAALPAELQKELKAAYDQRQRQGEDTTHQPPASVSGKLGSRAADMSISRRGPHCSSAMFQTECHRGLERSPSCPLILLPEPKDAAFRVQTLYTLNPLYTAPLPFEEFGRHCCEHLPVFFPECLPLTDKHHTRASLGRWRSPLSAAVSGWAGAVCERRKEDPCDYPDSFAEVSHPFQCQRILHFS